MICVRPGSCVLFQVQLGRPLLSDLPPGQLPHRPPLCPKAAVVPSAQTLRITDFGFSDFELSDLETALCTIRMFTDLGLVQSFQMKHEVGLQRSPSGVCLWVSCENTCVHAWGLCAMCHTHASRLWALVCLVWDVCRVPSCVCRCVMYTRVVCACVCKRISRGC